jgi:outer membrane protein TolC
MTDHREKARIAAIVSRRRAQLSRLERLITEVRKQLEADEQKLERVMKNNGPPPPEPPEPHVPPVPPVSTNLSECKLAGKALRRCAEARKGGGVADDECREAGKALRQCGIARGRTGKRS